MYFNFQNEDALTLRFSLARAGRIVRRRRRPRERVAGGKDLEVARAGKIVGRTEVDAKGDHRRGLGGWAWLADLGFSGDSTSK